MNLCVVSFQAVLLVVLVQYHYTNEVEAEKQVSFGNWFSSIEKQIDDVPDRIRMNKVYQEIKKATKNILTYPRRLIHQAFGIGTDNKDTVNEDHNAGVKISDLLNSQEQRDLIAVNGISNMTGEVNYEAGAAPSRRQVVLEKQKVPKRKRIVKKLKKKHKSKRDQQRLDASVEKDKVEFGKTVMKKKHKKREKVRIKQRKFVKTLPKESNSSESNEVQRRKPVDIIVHIKMND